MKLSNRSAAGAWLLLIGIVFSPVAPAPACGPDFPNELLDRGDDAVLAAPVADFSRELARLHLLSADFQAVPTNDYAAQTLEADLADLRAALGKSALDKAGSDEIVLNYQNARTQLASSETNATPEPQAPSAAPAPAKIIPVPEGLPGEFADYFRGSIAWHHDLTNDARAAWEGVLARPAAERHYRSTWAAYMLGKSWLDEDAAKSMDYFQKCRSLAAAGFADRLGLAAASIGWEARAELHAQHFDRAMQLYLQQLATGDDSAPASLRMTATKALAAAGDDQLAALAGNAGTRRVVTAYICSREHLESLLGEYAWDSSQTNRSIVLKWLGAVEAANISDVESAEQLALAAYQAGQWELAHRWLERSTATPVTEWLEAKLLLRAGKLEDAAAKLEKVAHSFPADPGTNNLAEAADLMAELHIPGSTYLAGEVSAPAQVRAELGVLHLARREYTEALDALLRSGFWMDAAYVAERVLTLDELKAYVDRNWPEAGPAPDTDTNSAPEAAPPMRKELRQEIRYLLARRLTRMRRGSEATEYYPVAQRADLASALQNAAIGNDTTATPARRATAWFELAKLVRHQGMELLGTEVEPDWHVHDGDFQDGVTVGSRATTAPGVVLFASEDERQRAQQQGVNPDARFHYRYQAATLAWQAAVLMPDNSEETARVLCAAGTWLKKINPQMADIFYKALVRRCRKTDIGETADRMRWFPILDDNGNLVPWTPDPPSQSEDYQDNPAGGPEKTLAGYWYILHRGNSLADIVKLAQDSHQLNVTVKQILAANPGAEPSRLKIGQKIFVPLQPSESPQNPEAENLPEPVDGSGQIR